MMFDERASSGFFPTKVRYFFRESGHDVLIRLRGIAARVRIQFRIDDAVRHTGNATCGYGLQDAEAKEFMLCGRHDHIGAPELGSVLLSIHEVSSVQKLSGAEL